MAQPLAAFHTHIGYEPAAKPAASRASGATPAEAGRGHRQHRRGGDEIHGQELLPHGEAEQEAGGERRARAAEGEQGQRAQRVHLGVLADVVERERDQEARAHGHEEPGRDGGAQAARVPREPHHGPVHNRWNRCDVHA